MNDVDILAARGPKNSVDPFRAYHAIVEPELSANGIVEDVATIFLTNRECPFRCLMCDLWQSTTDQRVPVGAIPTQIRHALESLPAAQHIKLYNSGNFFDAQAIPPKDFPAIAELVGGFKSVIVENHPQLCSDRCVEFQELCGTQLEIAMGLETSHEPTLAKLNKQMTVGDFATACESLRQNHIRLRTFILLRPPDTPEDEGVQRAIESVRFAFDCGVDCCAVIPTRTGNGIMEQLEQRGRFTPPQLTSLEVVLQEAVAWKRGRVFADLWDVRQFAACDVCADARIKRLSEINLTQQLPPPIECTACAVTSETSP
ncbi:radical SAM protein [Fuerstiella marisgermanici]|uniref:Elp3/MiaA/NifB-like radical SAM core domain-containing protein n=1 Tax=Fuerstiella marisgermanici TaxID=1891926 RepID=A0A1P8WRW7_9PLAN|nr:radical SAM protein [Fuerstiella marisgermanici]APZ96804.1 hypothetical protein Fuma_06478 [Fuerstiella marisgermanici]